MKYIILILSFFVLSTQLKAQLPNQLSQGNSSTAWYQKGTTGADLGIHWRLSFGDTTAANSYAGGILKNIAGLVIRCVNDYWSRSNDLQSWNKINGGGSAAIPTWQQTLTAGSTLTGANTIAGGNFAFAFNNASSINLNTTNTGPSGIDIGGINGHVKIGDIAGAFQSTILDVDATDANAGVITADNTPHTIRFSINTTTPDSALKVVGGIYGTRGLRLSSLTNLSTQNRLLGQFGTDGNVGYITLAGSLSLSAGVLTGTGITGLTVGTTTIASGTTTRILYDNAGVLGEYTITGSGTAVAMQTSPSFVTSVIGGASFDAFNTISTTLNFGGAATTMTIGGTPTTAITHNYSTNATATATTKTVNVATGGAAGSTTNVNIASVIGGTTALNSPIITIGGGTTASDLRFFEGSGGGANYVGFKANATLAGNTIYTLPTAFPAGTYLLNSTSTGEIGFTDPSTITSALTSTYIGYGSGSNTVTGDANLTYTAASSAVALDSGYLSFTGHKEFGSSVTGSIFKHSTYGLTFRGVPGASYDMLFFTQGGSTLFANPTGTTQMGTVGDWGFGLLGSTISAKVHIAAGSTAAGSAPLKINSGSLMTTAETGAVEFLTDKYYGTITTGAARKEFTLNDIALTSGRVPFTTTNGRLTDLSTFTFGSGLLSVPQIKGSSSAPSIVGGVGAGTTPTVSISGTDLAGMITVTTDTDPAAGSVFCTITFATAYGTAPFIQLTPADDDAALLSFDNGSSVTKQIYVTSTTSTFVINTNSGSPPYASTQFKWYYQVIQ